MMITHHIPGWDITKYIKVWSGRLCHFLDHIINIIFWYWSYTHNTDQNLCWTWNFWNIFESATLDLNVMELCHPYPLCWVQHQAQPNGLAWHLTQHNGQGLDYSIVHTGLVLSGSESFTLINVLLIYTKQNLTWFFTGLCLWQGI
jgi:hypothetical protein